MNAPPRVRLLLKIVAAGALTIVGACASNATSPMLQASPAGSQARPRAQSGTLIYASYPTQEVAIYSYPDGSLLDAKWPPNNTYGSCPVPNGSVWMTANESGGHDITQVYQYMHRDLAPSRNMVGPSTRPLGCAYDKISGDLAVATLGLREPGAVVVFLGSKPDKWKTYQPIQHGEYRYAAYDDKGNLFVDGDNARTKKFVLAELPRGAMKFTVISLAHPIHAPGGPVGRRISARRRRVES
jgi:hypothetical protein